MFGERHQYHARSKDKETWDSRVPPTKTSMRNLPAETVTYLPARNHDD